MKEGGLKNLIQHKTEMASKVYENEHHPGALLKSIQVAREENQYLDITFTVGSRKISAHKLVMCGLSEYFKNILEMDAKNSNDITLKEVNFDAFEMLVNYAYTGKIEIQSENIYKLLQSSDYFQVTFVKSACEAFLAKQLDLRIKQLELETWLELFFMSETYSLANLKKLCFVYLAEFFEDINQTDSFQNIPVDIMLEFLKRDKMPILRNDLPIKEEDVELVLFRGVLKYASLKEISNEDVRKLLWSIRYNFFLDKKVQSVLKEWPKMANHKEIALLLKELEDSALGESLNFGIRRYVPIPQVLTDKAYCAVTGNHHLPTGRYFTAPDNAEWLNANIVQITLWIRRWDGRPVLGGIVLKYTSGKRTQFGGPAPGHLHISEHVVDLGDGEYITQVNGRHGWLIDKLHFITNRGREFGPFGGDGGCPFECKHTVSDKPLFLHGFCGEVLNTEGSKSIKNAGFIWKYYQRE